ncbi:hypothetical protein [Thalassotalea loyana]|uniref:hypothetical protein n=1 Tax=Thalassotalea loyana TaxID=280483 RepID=UPI0024E13C8B|nr:hypothetical protein [Thalassotalea loyana]
MTYVNRYFYVECERVRVTVEEETQKCFYVLASKKVKAALDDYQTKQLCMMGIRY